MPVIFPVKMKFLARTNKYVLEQTDRIELDNFIKEKSKPPATQPQQRQRQQRMDDDGMRKVVIHEEGKRSRTVRTFSH